MAKRALNREWLPEPNIWDQGSFVPASSQDPSSGMIVLPEAYLDFPGTSSTGMPGIFSCPPGYKNPKQPFPILHQKASYDLTVEDIPLSANKIVRYIISPTSDTTTIPMNLQNNACSKNHFTNNPTNVQETVYSLQSKKGGSSLVSGLCTNVKLDLVVWDSERFTREGGIYGEAARRFQIDGAVLLDPKRPGQFHPSESPVCLLGMDFLTKYPYLLFEPGYDTRGEIDFTFSRGPLTYRPYSTCAEVGKTLVVHISARHDIETDRIGCGVFFKSGSILNLFSGVSKYDKDGNKHTEQLWERGILMGVIKALHVVAAFPTDCEFTDVLIRTGSPPTNSLLSQLQHTTDDLQGFGKNCDDYTLGNRFSCLSPNSDMVMYIYRQFIRKKSDIMIHFHGFSTNENYDAVEAAGILASAGTEMEEFYIENEVKSASTQYRSHKHKFHDVTLLHHHGGFVGHTIYASLGLDGYFHIPKERAHMAMEAADKKACLALSREDAVRNLGYAAWEGEVAAQPNGLLDVKNYEYHTIPRISDFTTLDGILGEDTAKNLRVCLEENSMFVPEQVLRIIQNSTREIKVHEFLSMQTKEYREGYLEELEKRGLEKGWHFCKDKAWNGYLRRNIRIYNRDRRMRSRPEEKMGGGIFTLSNENMNLSQWDGGGVIGKAGHTGDARGKKQQRGFQAEAEAGLVVRKDVEGCHQAKEERKEPHGKAQLKKNIEEVSPSVNNDLSPSNSPSRYLPDINCNDGMNEKFDTSTEQLTISGESSHIGYCSDKMEHMRIRARVATRHRYGPKRVKGRYASFRDGILDVNYDTDDSSDLDYVGDSDGHSSGSSSDSLDLSCVTHDGKDKVDYLRNLNSMRIHQQWGSQFSDTIPARADIIPNLKNSASQFNTALKKGQKEVEERKQHKEGEGRLEKTSMADFSRIHNTSARHTEKLGSNTKGVENKWPSSNWMLEKFQEDTQ